MHGFHRHSGYAVRRICRLALAGLFCALPAQGQIIQEGYPTKPVSEEPSDPSFLLEECGPFLLSGEFAEDCAGDMGGDNGPDIVGIGLEEAGSSGVVLDPALRVPPRLECPSAVFLEEMETTAIDCRAWDAAGEEHLRYYWEPVAGSPRDYLEDPRLIPEDARNPSVVAPSFPEYETLESFLSEEGAQRYRYRLTATSRATGLSSRSEVEVFVLSSRPVVYCPSEIEVEEGASVALSCEGADPMSFRMNDGDGAGASSALWEWEGLWGASTAPLTAADTPSPLFTAPAGSAGETYRYVASMTTSSSGVPRTARRRVNVTVKAGDGNAAPSIRCNDSSVYEASDPFTLDCTATDAPDGATYGWTGTDVANRLTDTDKATPTFHVPRDIPGIRDNYREEFAYEVTMFDGNARAATAGVTVTVREKPDIESCLNSSNKNATEGGPRIPLDGCVSEPRGAPGGSSSYVYEWKVREGSATPPDALSLLDNPNVRIPWFTPPLDIPRNTFYEYDLIISAPDADPFVFEVDVTVQDRDEGLFKLVCADDKFSVHAGPGDIILECDALLAPADPSWKWTPRFPTLNTDKLSNPNIRNPVFDVPRAVSENTSFYYTVRVDAGGQSQIQDVLVEVVPSTTINITCQHRSEFSEGDNPGQIGVCSFTRGQNSIDPGRFGFRFEWRGERTTDARFANDSLAEWVAKTLSATNVNGPVFDVPQNVDRHETYTYWREVYTRGIGAEALLSDRRITVQVLDRDLLATLDISCEETDIEAYAGDPPITLNCEATGVPEGRIQYEWESVPNNVLHLLRLDNPDIKNPVFTVPFHVSEREEYEYRLTATAPNAMPAQETVTIAVLPRPPADIDVTCANPDPVYEGAAPVALICSTSNPPAGFAYEYLWEARGATPNTDRLTDTDVPAPMFNVPEAVEKNEIYEYSLTVSLSTGERAQGNVTVTVLNKVKPGLSCTSPVLVYEDTPDFALECSAPDAPAGVAYEYVWEARGGAADADRLAAGTDGLTPTFDVPENVDGDTTYEYRLTMTSPVTDPATADVTVTVLNRDMLALSCVDPEPVYEGSPDFALECSAPLPPAGVAYEYVWESRGAAADADRLTDTDGLTPTFDVPEDVPQTTRYEYRLTVTSPVTDPAAADVTVTVLNSHALTLACAGNPYEAYEGSEDIPMNCEALGAPEDAVYAYRWEARGATADTERLLAGLNDPSQIFDVPNNVNADETYEYLLTATAPNADPAMLDVTVTVLNKGSLALVCPDSPYTVYEGSGDFALECSAAGAAGDAGYEYAWEARGDTRAASGVTLLSATDIASPRFATPDSVDRDETYEYRLTATAPNREAAAANVTVTVLDRLPPPDPTSVGVEVSIASLRFGVQSSDTQVSLDPLSDRISTSLSGPHHAGRMMLSHGEAYEASSGDAGGKAVFIEMETPVLLSLEGEGASSLVLSPSWSVAESCEQLSSRSAGGLRTEVRLAESDCRLLLFGGSLDLSDAPAGRYSGNIDVTLRSGVGEETHSVEVGVTVVSPRRATTVGPGGARFDASREAPTELTEEQNVRIYPDVAHLTRDKPSGAFELSNPSLVPLEVSVSARFGYTEATEDGQEAVVEDLAVSSLGDLSEVLDIYPQTLVLMPGEQGVVRYGVREDALSTLTEAGYAAFFEVASSPRQYIRADRMPEAVRTGNTGRVTMRFPGVYIPGERVASLRAELLFLSEGASLSATFLVEAVGAPFVGEVVAYDGDGRELGRRRTLVYTRSRVRVPLEWTPEDEVVFLRFAPLGSGRVSEPVPVPWNALRRIGREIGAVPFGISD